MAEIFWVARGSRLPKATPVNGFNAKNNKKACNPMITSLYHV